MHLLRPISASPPGHRQASAEMAAPRVCAYSTGALGRGLSGHQGWAVLITFPEPAGASCFRIPNLAPSFLVGAQEVKRIGVVGRSIAHVPPYEAAVPPDSEFPFISGVQYPENVPFMHGGHFGFSASGTCDHLIVRGSDESQWCNHDGLSEQSLNYASCVDCSGATMTARCGIERDVTAGSPRPVIKLVKGPLGSRLKRIGAFDHPDGRWCGVSAGALACGPSCSGRGNQQSSHNSVQCGEFHDGSRLDLGGGAWKSYERIRVGFAFRATSSSRE